MNKRSAIIITGVASLIISFPLLLIVHIYLQTESKKGWETVNSVRIDSSFQKDPLGRTWYQVSGRSHIESLEGDQINVPVQGEEFLSSFIFDNHGRLWASTSNGLLIQDLNGVWNRYVSPIGPDPILKLLAADDNGRVWVRWGNDYKFSFVEFNLDKSRYSYNYESTLVFEPGNFIPVYIGPDGNIWVIHGERLMVFSSEDHWVVNKEADFSEANSMVFDNQGKLWIGGGNNKIRVIDQDFSLSTVSSGVKDEPIRVEDIDSNGRVWGRIGMGYSGLYSFTDEDGGRIINTQNSGLLDDTVRDVAVNQAGDVWVATAHDIVKFSPEQESASKALIYGNIIRKGLFPSIPLLIVLITLNVWAFTQPGASDRNQLRDFAIGFFGWLIITGLFFLGINTLSEAMGESGMVLIVCLFFPIPATLIAVIITWIKRRPVAVGILSGVLVGFITFFMLWSDIGRFLE